MAHRLIKIFISLLLLTPGCAKKQPSAKSDRQPVAAAQPKLKLVLLVVVDQLPLWSFLRDKSQFSGGVKQLMDDGSFFAGEYPYANTYTAPGHAAIGTGNSPKSSGILANSWYSRSVGGHIGVVDDPRFPSFNPKDPASVIEGSGVSTLNLISPGLADALRETHPESRSVAVGLKERAASLVLGQKADLAIWYDDDFPGMTTSKFFVDAMPSWLVSFNKKNQIEKHFKDVWEPLQPRTLRTMTGISDDAPGEGSGKGITTTFPHSLADTNAAKALRSTPLGTDLVFQTAEAAVVGMKLGKQTTPDLLALTISSHDFAGHYWGQESWERSDLMLRFDQSLGDFFDFLDQQVGKGQYSVLLTSDHGAMPMIEQSRKKGHDAFRISPVDIAQAAQNAAQKILGKGVWILAVTANNIYVADKITALPKSKRRRVLESIVRSVSKVKGVGFTALTEDITGDCDTFSKEEALACRTVHPDRSGEIFIAPGRFSIAGSIYKTGTSHGTPNPEDRFVPVLAFNPLENAGGKAKRAGDVFANAIKNPVSMLRIAPTISSWLGITLPNAKFPSFI